MSKPSPTNIAIATLCGLVAGAFMILVAGCGSSADALHSDAGGTNGVGPLDNDESSFATGIPVDNIDACKQDCFFDGNSGMGDDGCMWQLKCDPMTNNASCPYDQAY